MKRNHVLTIIAAHKEELLQMGVKSLNLFGSVARDEATENSDVDFLVEFNRQVGLFDFIKVKLYLEDILGCAVDMGTVDALREHMRVPVTKNLIRVI
jgi:hypothetical protein